MPRAAIVGDLVLDVVAGAAERPGGAVWYCARALSQIDPDADVVLVCRCAPEDHDALVPGLEKFGFPVRWQPTARTTRFSFHYEGDRRIMSIDALSDPWTRADIAGWVGDAIGDAPWVHRRRADARGLPARDADRADRARPPPGARRAGPRAPRAARAARQRRLGRPRDPRPHHRAEAERRGGRGALRRHRRGGAPLARDPRGRAHARVGGRA